MWASIDSWSACEAGVFSVTINIHFYTKQNNKFTNKQTTYKIIRLLLVAVSQMQLLNKWVNFGQNRRLRRSLVNFPVSFCFRFHFAFILWLFPVYINLSLDIIWSIAHLFTTVIQRLDYHASRYLNYDHTSRRFQYLAKKLKEKNARDWLLKPNPKMTRTLRGNTHTRCEVYRDKWE